MTKEEVKSSLSEDIDTLYKIELLDGNVFHGAIDGPYLGHHSDLRGYTEPYIHITSVDIGTSSNFTVNCSDILSISGMEN